MAELKEEIQDWTFKMADGRIYTKYNYADYIEGRHVHGMAGQQSGLGLFTIQASHEYLNGGPIPSNTRMYTAIPISSICSTVAIFSVINKKGIIGSWMTGRN